MSNLYIYTLVLDILRICLLFVYILLHLIKGENANYTSFQNYYVEPFVYRVVELDKNDGNYPMKLFLLAVIGVSYDCRKQGQKAAVRYF